MNQTKNTKLSFATKVAAMRFSAQSQRVYFSRALFALHIVECEALPEPTMAIDRYGRVYAHPAFVAKTSVQKLAGVLIHELGHWLRRHHEGMPALEARATESDRVLLNDLANIAQDCELNDDLRKEGLDLPEGYMHPKLFDLPEHLLWQEYYELLKKKVTKARARSTDCGSASHGGARDYELPSPQKGDGRTYVPGLNEGEAELVRRATAEAIRAHVKKGIGKIAGGWKLWANAMLEEPQVAWQDELSALVQHAVTTSRGDRDYSYLRPSRRGTFLGVIQPTMVSPDPHACVVVDTSGSMGMPERMAVLTEVEGILQALGQRRVPVLCVDTEVHGGLQHVSSALDVNLLGGGGTNMGAGIQAADALGYGVTIVCTDGMTPWPENPPRAELVVVLVIAARESAPSVPEYAARTLVIDHAQFQK